MPLSSSNLSDNLDIRNHCYNIKKTRVGMEKIAKIFNLSANYLWYCILIFEY
jgi:hypothetical protein